MSKVGKDHHTPAANTAKGRASIVGARAAHTATLAQQLARQAQQKRLRARPKGRSDPPTHAQAPAWTQAAHASPTQHQGMQAEQRVHTWLSAQGICVLAHNLPTKYGEIDLVCIDAGVLVFVEVRQRSNTRYGGAAASVGRQKQLRLTRTAQIWLPHLVARHFGGKMPQCRFDVITVQTNGIQWLKHAFTV